MHQGVFFFVLLSLYSITCAVKTPLYFSYITSLTGDFVASGGIPIIDKALEEINSRTDILENYTLNYTTILDSQVSISAVIFYSVLSTDCYLIIISVQCIICSWSILQSFQ